METITLILFLVPALVGVAIVNVWAAPRLFPVAGRINLRLAHLMVLLSATLTPALAVALGLYFPRFSLERFNNPGEALALLTVGAAIVSAGVAHLADRLAGNRSGPPAS